MYSSWFNATLLAMESGGVVGLRMLCVAAGGPEARRETELMMTEKVMANLEAATTLMTGGTVDTVIGRYREQVAANAARLSATMFAGFGGCATPSLPRR